MLSRLDVLMGERGSTSPEKKGSNKGKKTYEFNTDDSKNEGEGKCEINASGNKEIS